MPLNSTFTQYGNLISPPSQVIQADPGLNIQPGERLRYHKKDGTEVDGLVTTVDHSISPDGHKLYLTVDLSTEQAVRSVPRTCWQRILAAD